ncbi:MAG: ABC transporter permease [Deltaproteobacteria bacterium]|nr:ABC transporter permease [Deltaproteobacteria bacterium]
MLAYALKRLLMIPPTFFMVSLVIFVVLNLAPGRPGEQAQLSGEKAGTQQRESYRIFKEQFNLDKPVLFNTRFALTESEVKTLLENAYALRPATKTAQRLHAQNELEDTGTYLVRHLVSLLGQTPDVALARAITTQLVQAARRPLRLDAHDPNATVTNRTIAAQNAEFMNWTLPDSATDAEVHTTAVRWQNWWQRNHEDFEYEGKKLRLLFSDTRFYKYWSNVLHFDFGQSTLDRRPVMPTIVSKLRYSLSLTLLSVLLAYLIAIPLGVWSAVRQNTRADTAMTVTLFVLYSLPTFFVGTVFLRFFTEGDPVAWFPAGDFESYDADRMTTLQRLRDVAWHLVLPIAAYTLGSLAALSRYARTGLVDVIRADYIRTARAKGVHEFVVIVKHAARNGMIPILTLLGSLLPVLVSGSVIIEVIFNIPGMGLYLYDAINLRDYNAVMGVLMMASVLTLFGILLSDLSYALADPRITFD